MNFEKTIKKNKKSQGISLNVVIVAAIVLIVLVVLIVIFSGRMKTFNYGLVDCHSKNGQCQSQPCSQGSATIPHTNCNSGTNTEQYCCVPI